MIRSLALLSFLLLSLPGRAQDAYFYYNKGMGQMAYENYPEAIKEFSKAVELNTSLANGFANRGLCYHRLKQYDLALADYQKTEVLVAGQGSYNMACAYALLGKTDDAFQWLTVCQKSEFKQSRAMLEGDTDFENIRKDARWKKMVETDWYSAYDKAIQEIDVKYIAKDMPGAIEQCGKAMALEPTKSKPYLVRLILYSNMQEWAKAMADCDKAIQLNPKDWEGYASKAGLLYKQKKYEEALGLYQQAMKLNPEYAPYFDLGMANFAAAKTEEALKDLKTYLEFFPKDDFGVYFAGFLCYNLKQDAPAMAYALKAIEMNPEITDYHLLKANINLASKNLDNAIADYTKVLGMNDKSGEAYYKRAIAKAERFAKTGDKQDKKDFCADMEKAEGFNYQGAAQYLRELCN